MVTTPVMEVKVTSSTPTRSAPQILTGTLQAQLLVLVTPQAKKSQYFEYDQAQIIKTTKTTPPQQ